jgi:ABC-type transporter Mla maintaining outer membrane lipid asymmetry permease subunit MlaE
VEALPPLTVTALPGLLVALLETVAQVVLELLAVQAVQVAQAAREAQVAWLSLLLLLSRLTTYLLFQAARRVLVAQEVLVAPVVLGEQVALAVLREFNPVVAAVAVAAD